MYTCQWVTPNKGWVGGVIWAIGFGCGFEDFNEKEKSDRVPQTMESCVESCVQSYEEIIRLRGRKTKRIAQKNEGQMREF
nr:hypothetical protein Iba_chr03cCG4880 [Ipomoea batatas]